MAWNPKLNFQLRDDETTLGELVIDTAAIPQIQKLLCTIREGSPIDMQGWTNYLRDTIYTNEEFSRIKNDFDVIKSDMRFMRQIWGSQKWHVDLKGFVDRADNAVNYIVGSKTWLEQYRETKMLAAELFARLKANGVQHELMPELEKRYGQVLAQSTTEERLLPQLQRQYTEAVMNNDANAVANYIAAQHRIGIEDKNFGGSFDSLLGAATSAIVANENLTNSPIDVQTSEVANESVEDTVDIRELEAVSVTAVRAISIGRSIISCSDSEFCVKAGKMWLDIFAPKIYENMPAGNSVVNLISESIPNNPDLSFESDIISFITKCIKELDMDISRTMFDSDMPMIAPDVLDFISRENISTTAKETYPMAKEVVEVGEAIRNLKDIDSDTYLVYYEYLKRVSDALVEFDESLSPDIKSMINCDLTNLDNENSDAWSNYHRDIEFIIGELSNPEIAAKWDNPSINTVRVYQNAWDRILRILREK